MTVENQIPYQTYTANGTDSSFALGFYVEDKANFIVKIDDTTISNNNYIYNNTTNSIMFNSAPTAGQIITIERNTSLDRTINYSTYNNTFRPETLNFDLDRIWRKLQELGVADQLLKIYTDRLHIEQKGYVDDQDQLIRNMVLDLHNYVNQQDNEINTSINNLKSYVDTQDSSINSYFENMIQQQGISLNQLNNYYNYLVERINNISTDHNWVADLIVTRSGKNQQQINDLGGVDYWHGGTYPLHGEVRLDNGDVVRSTIANNTKNPNLDMTGWVKNGNTYVKSISELLAIPNPIEGQNVRVQGYYVGDSGGGGTFVYNSSNASVYDGGVSFGKWRRQFDTLIPQHFGVQGNFSTKTLGDFYATLSNAQILFSSATALTDLHDRVAFATYLQYLIANSVRTDWTCQILLDVPLPSYTAAKTTLIDGALELKSHKTYLKYCFHIATSLLVLTGSIKVSGSHGISNDMRSRYIEHGVVCGASTKLGLTGSAQNCDLGTIVGTNLLGYVLAFMANCHFSKARQVRGWNAGSANNHSTIKYLQGVVDDFTFISSSGGDVNQRSLLQVTDTEIFTKITNLEPIRVVINNLPYDVTSIDQTNKQISIYPSLPPSLTTGTLLYVWGGVLMVDSGNTACTSVSTCEAIVCGYGLNAPSLYGIAIDSFISEFCGIAISTGLRSSAHLGTTLQLAYFEANKVDILYSWAQTNSNALQILNTIALNPSKIHNMYAYTIGESRRRDWAYMGSGKVYLESGSPLTLEKPVWELHSQSINTAVIVSGALTVNMTYNPKIAELTNRRQKVVNLVHNTTSSAVVTINAPSGYTVNGEAALTLDMNHYTGVVSIAFYVPLSIAEVLPTDIKVVITGNRKVVKGTTAQRPSNPVLGLRYYDTTLLAAGKPIEWNGISWVDLTGTTV